MNQRRRFSRSLDVFVPSTQAQAFRGWRRIMIACLRRLGPTWRAAPIRRVIQTLGLLLYLWLLLYVSWPYAKVFTGRVFSDKEWLPVEVFLWLDPLVGLSTSMADRSWNAAFTGMVVTLCVCALIPRAFCGYFCPLGTMIDGFDFVVGKRVHYFKARQRGWWAGLRYYFLAAILVASCGGVLLSGLLAAIPLLTRGLLFTGGQLELGFLKNWSMVPATTPAVCGSIVLFAVVFLLGLLGPRFWCRYVCPSGALVSLPGLLRLARRQVDGRCLHCGQCIAVCPFDAIHADGTTRPLQCAFCQTCAGMCPRQAIHFISGSTHQPISASGPSVSPPVSRRALILSGISGAVTALVVRAVPSPPTRPLRPPGSVWEARFLDLCIRCEQCLKVCPGPVLQGAGLTHGIEALWTPVAVFAHAGCHPECNFCTQVCPTGAIQPLDHAEKRHARIGLAIIDPKLCLPHRAERDCQLCFDECNAAGYQAIEMRRVQIPVGQIPEGTFSSAEVEAMSSIAVPVVKTEACVGCGLCEYRCHSVNVRQKKLLGESAVVVKA